MEHHKTEIYGVSGIIVCDTCVNSLGYPINWEQAPCHKSFDPLPYRYLNNANIRYATPSKAPVSDKVFFEPRPGYEQDQSKYLL